ncbi:MULTISPECIES: thioredoxin domain-containing protein [unclassified Streptomyces]|uniref:thioredoxin domain-containing protein n=1 Tax=unclassified Streptomyces TaxID=2593676 RepID=UPI0006AD8FD6|nr:MULTISPECIES: thioredoxin domain-containing protein [unclassified Streptomyces]KOX28612.1 membrane protein [Streptomyces sp. NRRL F-6491]KOX41900.1 membrane protein [Streptomyces sp. NRRL F-6492]
MKISTIGRAAVAAGLVGAVAGCAPGGTRAGETSPDAQQAGEARPAARPEAVRYASAAQLPEQTALDGTTIVVGNPAARSTVHLYEDPRCPVVEEYERTGAKSLEKLLLAGEIKAQYTFASFKDDRLEGDGSKRAVNALRAALEKDKFVEYHRVLFDHQTDVESSGGFTTQRLLQLADKVPGLRDETFDQAVRTMRYRPFVTASEKAYEHTGDDPRGPGTPTVVVNGHMIDGALYPANFDPRLFTLLVTDLHQRPHSWDKEYKPLKDKLDAQAADS